MFSRVLFLLLCSCAADRLASVPPYDHIADVSKALTIKSDGSGAQWSAASSVTGITSYALGATNAVTSGDLVAFSGTGGKQLVDSGISGNSSPAHSLLGVAGNTGSLSAISSSAANQVMVSNSGGTGILFGQVSLGSSSAVTGVAAIANGGTASATAGSGFQNLSPQTTKGDLVSYATAPVREPVGASGGILTVYPGNASGIGWSTSTTRIWGTQTNDNATAGYVGETLNCNRAQGGTGFTSGTPGNICSTGGNSITLTPGDWQVSGACGFLPSGTTSITVMDCAVSKTSATLPSAAVLADPSAGEIWMTHRQAASVNGNYITFSIPSFRVSVSASTPLYLVAGATFTVSTMSGYGYLEARRMR